MEGRGSVGCIGHRCIGCIGGSVVCSWVITKYDLVLAEISLMIFLINFCIVVTNLSCLNSVSE